MNRGIVYASLILVCLGAGILTGGSVVYFLELQKTKEVRKLEVECHPRADRISDSGLKISGSILLSHTLSKDILLEGKIRGLPVGEHGFHIHTDGIVDQSCASAGLHFNPTNTSHGSPSYDQKRRHFGDLGNIVSNTTGTDPTLAEVLIHDKIATLFGKDSILGRSIVIHNLKDDFINYASAGPMMACCNIIHKTKTIN